MTAKTCAIHRLYGLRDSLVSSARGVLVAVGEEVVHDQTEDGEEEDTKEPKELVRRRPVGLEELDYKQYHVRKCYRARENVSLELVESKKKLTKDNNVQDQDNESNNTATGAELPGVAVGAGTHSLLSHSQGEKTGLN